MLSHGTYIRSAIQKSLSAVEHLLKVLIYIHTVLVGRRKGWLHLWWQTIQIWCSSREINSVYQMLWNLVSCCHCQPAEGDFIWPKNCEISNQGGNIFCEINSVHQMLWNLVSCCHTSLLKGVLSTKLLLSECQLDSSAGCYLLIGTSVSFNRNRRKYVSNLKDWRCEVI